MQSACWSAAAGGGNGAAAAAAPASRCAAGAPSTSGRAAPPALLQHQHRQPPHTCFSPRRRRHQRWPCRSSGSVGPSGSGGSGSGSGSGDAAAAAAAGGPAEQVYRFRHAFSPDPSRPDSWAGLPADAPPPPGSARVGVATEGVRVDPSRLWGPAGPDGAVALPNPHAQRFRVAPAAPPVPAAPPGGEWWHVEALGDYSRAWPRLERVPPGGKGGGGGWRLRPGFLQRFDDPEVVPFFFYRGLERLTYSWPERAAQAAFAVAYLGAHAAACAWLCAAVSPALAAAVALNWGLGRLSPAKWALLLLLAACGRVWVYWLFLGARLVDAGLARLFPPVRRVFWAFFTVWALYVALSPLHYYPLPLAPFAPGTAGGGAEGLTGGIGLW